MTKTKPLSGIERELVLQYLIDGNVPVTISTVSPKKDEESDSFELRPMDSAVFPVALKAENVSVLKEGIILLKNPPKSVNSFIEKNIRVEFYFNRVGLFFETKMKLIKAGPAIVIPASIERMEDSECEEKYDFTAKLYFSEENNISFDCVPAKNFLLFSRPVWSSILLEKQVKAKKYLESFVDIAKKNGKAGNGIQLVNICRYFVEDRAVLVQSVQGRVLPFDILFIDHNRIVLGYEKNDSFDFTEGGEYQIQMSFVLRENHFINRTIKALLRVDVIYSDEEKKRFASDCSFCDLQYEDQRYLYERATSTIMR